MSADDEAQTNEGQTDDERQTDGGQTSSRNVTRREVLFAAGFTAGGLAVGGAVGFGISQTSDDSADEAAETPGEAPVQALTFFTPTEAALVAAVAARIYPSDENGPGAPEAGVVYFIDQQLAGAWGAGAGWYTQGPFADGEDTQGWQYDLTPRAVYSRSLRYLEEYCNEQYEQSFTELSEAEQDEVLEALSDGDVEQFQGIDAGDFFAMIRDNTLEGMFSDPVHGGNYDMVGWRLKEYPGHAMSYLQHIESEEFVELEPHSLAHENRRGRSLLPTPQPGYGTP